VREAMKGYFKDQVDELIKVEKCYFTFTKSEDFIIDWTD
jgi:hypothetical protein